MVGGWWLGGEPVGGSVVGLSVKGGLLVVGGFLIRLKLNVCRLTEKDKLIKR